MPPYNPERFWGRRAVQAGTSAVVVSLLAATESRDCGTKAGGTRWQRVEDNAFQLRVEVDCLLSWRDVASAEAAEDDAKTNR
jgi:hypothetical protein